MKRKLNKKIFYIYTLAFFGFLLILYYLWFRFVRERLPRDIPFTLTTFSFLSLCLICLLYVYILYRINVPLKSHNIFHLLYPQIQWLFKPLYSLDIVLQKSYILKNIMGFYFVVVVYLKLYKTKHNNYFFIMFNIIPKIFIMIIFIIDIFYFRTLHYFYFVLCLSLLRLFYDYNVHIITQYLSHITKHLDKNFHVKILSTREEENAFNKQHDKLCFFVFLSSLKYNDDHVLEAEYFIDCQCYNLIFDCQLYKYTCIETWFARDQYIKKHKLEYPEIWIYKPESDEISIVLAQEFKKLMPQAYYFKAFIDTHNDLVKDNFMSYNTKIIIIYLLCWIYILVISIHTLDIQELISIINLIKTDEDPFSSLHIKEYLED